LYDNRDIYYTSSQADTLSTLAQYSGADGRSGTHQQLNIQSSLIGTADDRQSELLEMHKLLNLTC